MDDWTEDELRRKIREEFDFEIDTSSAGLGDSDVQQRAADLLPILARRLGGDETQVRRRLTIGLDDALRVEGRTTSDDGWRTFDVRLSTGLLVFHHKMVGLLVSRISIVDDDQTVVEETRISDAEMLATARRLLDAFWAPHAPMERFLRTPGFPLVRLTKAQITLAASLLHYSEAFVIAHELGHVLLQAAPDRVKRERFIVDGAKDSMVGPVVATHERRGDRPQIDAWMEELAADFIGLGLCRDVAGDPIQHMAVHAGAAMALVMCEMLERYYRKLHATSLEARTHPPSGLRLDVLQTLSSWSTGQLGASFRQFGDYVMERI